jgi:hypothetical protein
MRSFLSRKCNDIQCETNARVSLMDPLNYVRKN